MDNFNNTFSFEPYKQHSVVPPDYTPDFDTTDICNDAKKAQYWQRIGKIQWYVSLGWIYIIYDTIVLYI